MQMDCERGSQSLFARFSNEQRGCGNNDREGGQMRMVLYRVLER